MSRPKATNSRPIIKDRDLFIETNFFAWLESEHEQGNKVDQFIDTIKRYTHYVDKPFKGRTDGKAHKYVHSHFWILKRKKDKFKPYSNII